MSSCDTPNTTFLVFLIICIFLRLFNGTSPTVNLSNTLWIVFGYYGIFFNIFSSNRRSQRASTAASLSTKAALTRTSLKCNLLAFMQQKLTSISLVSICEYMEESYNVPKTIHHSPVYSGDLKHQTGTDPFLSLSLFSSFAEFYHHHFRPWKFSTCWIFGWHRTRHSNCFEMLYTIVLCMSFETTFDFPWDQS